MPTLLTKADLAAELRELRAEVRRFFAWSVWWIVGTALALGVAGAVAIACALNIAQQVPADQPQMIIIVLPYPGTVSR